LCITVW